MTFRLVFAPFTFSLLFIAGAAADPGQSFDGPYLALDVSRQNTIGGALVAGVDTLAQASRSVGALSAGYRRQFAGGFVVGLEGGFGLTDGNLRHQDSANAVIIDYKNGTQYAFGGIAGFAPGKARETLIFGYLSETKRSFDVTVRGPLGVGSQKDKQGLLRYGLGVERRLSDYLSMRASLGSSRADFGDRRTNLNPRTRIDFSLGAVWQF